LPGLSEQGLDVEVSELLSDQYVATLYASGIRSRSAVFAGYRRRIREVAESHAPLTWVQQELLPWIPLALERLLVSVHAPLVVDIDDAIFHDYDRHPNRIVRGLFAQKYDGIFERARLVVAGSEYLAARARAAGAPWVEIVPSVVPVTQYAVREHHDRKTLRIGWIGSPASQHYLEELLPALDILAREGAFELILIGANRTLSTQMPVRMIPWTESGEKSILGEIDVGIMPLPDTPSARGKCGYKLIQSMASGVPVVASPVGANSTIVRDGVDGFHASNTAEWVTALLALRDDPDRRRRMGADARAHALESYSLERWGPALAALLRRAASDGGSPMLGEA
jgi:glycosyltransferase involved in cell wall biosynthesis